MKRWNEFAAGKPEMAEAGRALIYQFRVGLGYLATVRKDGGPRVHPVCPIIANGGLYVFIGKVVESMSVLKRRLTSLAGHYLWNPLVRLIAGRVPGGPALLETVGRKSGRPRQRARRPHLLDHRRAWSPFRLGTQPAGEPRVRVKVNGRWRSGTGYVMPDDDPVT